MGSILECQRCSTADQLVISIKGLVNMKHSILIFLLFITVSCKSEHHYIEFSGLKIPKDYVVQLPSNNDPKNIFDDIDSPILIGISEGEIQKRIPNFHMKESGPRELSILIYTGEVDAEGISESILTGFSLSSENVGPDLYSENMRYYRTSDDWLLVSLMDSQPFLVAQCNRSGIFRHINACSFKKNINGYGVYYDLENSNIALVKEFDSFIYDKIASWKMTNELPHHTGR